MHPKYQEKKLNIVRSTIQEKCKKVVSDLLTEVNDPDLTEEVSLSFPFCGIFISTAYRFKININNLGPYEPISNEDPNLEKMTTALKEFYLSLPSNSPIRSSFVKTMFSNCDISFTSDFLRIDFSTAFRELLVFN
ncbi:MAG: hypothetical protein ACXVHR_09095 [Methanobacterium sp.]